MEYIISPESFSAGSVMFLSAAVMIVVRQWVMHDDVDLKRNIR
jgi:hypothetical protein